MRLSRFGFSYVSFHESGYGVQRNSSYRPDARSHGARVSRKASRPHSRKLKPLKFSAIRYLSSFDAYLCTLARTQVCQNIPRAILERTYGFYLVQPAEGEDPNRPPRANELLKAYGCKLFSPFFSSSLDRQKRDLLINPFGRQHDFRECGSRTGVLLLL